MSNLELAIWAAFAVAQIADVVSTARFLRLGIKEANPIWRRMQERLGKAWVVPRILLAAGIAAGLYLASGSILPVAIMAVGVWGVVAWNVVQIKRSL